MKKTIDTIFLLFALVLGIVGLLFGLVESEPIKIVSNAFLLAMWAIYFVVVKLKKFS